MKKIKNQQDHSQQILPANGSGELTTVLPVDGKQSDLQFRRLDTFDLKELLRSWSNHPWDSSRF